MKKFVLFLLVAVCALLLVACGDTTTTTDDDKKADEQGGADAPSSEVKRDVAVADAKLSNVLGTGKLYLTTFGQASYDYAKQLVDEAVGTDFEYTAEKLLTADQVAAGDVVIAVVGYTSKGIDTKTITVTSETARAKAFAEKEGITLIIMQLEGSGRRGESSDPIIEAACAGADYVFVYEDGKGNGANYDGKYTSTWCKNNANYYEFSDEWNIYEYIQALVK